MPWVVIGRWSCGVVEVGDLWRGCGNDAIPVDFSRTGSLPGWTWRVFEAMPRLWSICDVYSFLLRRELGGVAVGKGSEAIGG